MNAATAGTATMIEVAVLAKTGGPLTKRISLGPDGTIRCDGSACVIPHGCARRTTFDDLGTFTACIGSLGSNETTALGALHDDLPDQAQIVSKANLIEANGLRHRLQTSSPGVPGLQLPPGGRPGTAEGNIIMFEPVIPPVRRKAISTRCEPPNSGQPPH
jgi:hypothetical protein